MAGKIPTGLQSADADIGRFAIRASQVESFNLVVAYWCESEDPASRAMKDQS